MKHNQKRALFAVKEPDAFVKRLLDKMPEALAASFNEEQKSALRKGLGMPQQSVQWLDKRGVVGLWRWRYFFVIIVGKDRRLAQRNHAAANMFFSAFLIIVGLGLGCFLMLVLYSLKSYLGINVFSEYSLGLWHWLTQP